VTITDLFYWFFTFHHDKHISHIHPNIHHIYLTSITYIACITIYITYITLSSQVHPNKSTSPSQVQIINTSASQVHHQVDNKCKDNYPDLHWECGVPWPRSFEGPGGGLFEPADWGCTKEKTLHVSDNKSTRL
jgi:hypothetical protein